MIHVAGICAGKHTLQDYLIQQHDFTPLAIDRSSNTSTPSIEKSATEASVQGDTTHQPAVRSFPTAQALLDFVTENWSKDFVTISIHSSTTAHTLLTRPFVLLIHIDSPLSIRWQRFSARCSSASLPPPTLEQFVLRNDAHLYAPTANLASLPSLAHLNLLNTSISLLSLTTHFASLDLPNQDRLRPNWDTYFMALAFLAAKRSNCMRRSVGCVLVRSKRVISTGYNGTPRNLPNCSSGGCPRCNNSVGNAGGTSLSTCLCIHAEENAMLEAGRERVGASGSVLYCTTCPCLTCSIKIVQVGVEEVVFDQSYYMDAEAAELFRKAGVRLRQFRGPERGLVVMGGDDENGGRSGVNQLAKRMQSLPTPNGDQAPAALPQQANGH